VYTYISQIGVGGVGEVFQKKKGRESNRGKKEGRRVACEVRERVGGDGERKREREREKAGERWKERGKERCTEGSVEERGGGGWRGEGMERRRERGRMGGRNKRAIERKRNRK